MTEIENVSVWTCTTQNSHQTFETIHTSWHFRETIILNTIKQSLFLMLFSNVRFQTIGNTHPEYSSVVHINMGGRHLILGNKKKFRLWIIENALNSTSNVNVTPLLSIENRRVSIQSKRSKKIAYCCLPRINHYSPFTLRT